MTNTVYADHAATTAVRPEVLKEMMPYFSAVYGNPSSLHTAGQEARKAVENSRRTIAGLLGAAAEELVFTAGGSESDNWILRQSSLRAIRERESSGRKVHLVSSCVEHHAVLRTLHYLEGFGVKVTYVPVDSRCQIDPEEVRKAITPDTVLVSIMMANNETGTIMPAEQIGQICREHGVIFHSDAVQALGKLPLDTADLPVDALSFSAHKIYGPKGTGALFVRRGIRLDPFVYGGRQERGRRAGTENVPGIVGFSKALELCYAERTQQEQKLSELTRQLIDGILQTIPGSHLNGIPAEERSGSSEEGTLTCLPGYVNVRFDGVQAESLLVLLDMNGVAASAGSACESGAVEVSHVLSAMGLSREQASSSIRLSLGRENTAQDVDMIVETLARTVHQLRRLQ